MWKAVVPEECEICPVETGHGQIRRLEEEAVYQACPGGQGREKETSANAHEMRVCKRACMGVCIHACVGVCMHASTLFFEIGLFTVLWPTNWLDWLTSKAPGSSCLHLPSCLCYKRMLALRSLLPLCLPGIVCL